MCWQVDLISYKGLTNAGSGANWPIYGSLWHLAKWKKTQEPAYTGTIPVNLSLGSLQASQFAIDMVEYALRNNIVLIASAGNSYAGVSSYPGSYTGVIRVGASDFLDRVASFSNYGPDVSVVAPGVNIISTGRGNAQAVASNSGTSMASPHVAGLVGYMLTFNPNLTPAQIKTYLERNADFIGGATGHTREAGWGRINTLKTIKAVIDDINAGVTNPASDYVATPVKINVSYVDGDATGALNGANVYLYQCDAAGTIQNYVATSISGASYAEIVDLDGARAQNGVAFFNMLKPGYYKAIASTTGNFDLAAGAYELLVDSTPVFEVAPNRTVEPLTIELNFGDSLHFITSYTSNADKRGTDTIIGIYDTAGNEIVTYDSDVFDAFSIKYPNAGGEYLVRITVYDVGNYNYSGVISWTDTSYYCGEYALAVTNNAGIMPHPGPAPGTFAVPGAGALKGSTSQTPATAQSLAFNQIAYGEIESGGTQQKSYSVLGIINVNYTVTLPGFNAVSGDWYRVVVPPASAN